MSGTIVHCFPALCIMLLQFTLCFYPFVGWCLGSISAAGCSEDCCSVDSLSAPCSCSIAFTAHTSQHFCSSHHQGSCFCDNFTTVASISDWILCVHDHYGLPQLLKAVPQFSLGGAGAGLSGTMACISCSRLLVSEAQGAAGHNLDNGGSSGTPATSGNITLGNRYDILQDFV